MTVATVVAVQAPAAAAEAMVVRAVGEVRVLRGRPVVAVSADIVRAVSPAVARSGQEDRTAIGSCDLSTVYSVDISPFFGAV